MLKHQNVLTLALALFVSGVLVFVAGPALMERRAVSAHFHAIASGKTSFEARRTADPVISVPSTATEAYEIMTLDGRGPNASCYALPNAEIFASGVWQANDQGARSGLPTSPKVADVACRTAHPLLPKIESRP